ncbi:MAG: YfhO family protein [Clostridiales bacterium]|nr:YfhO family protein [Clostridiales bacterium]
MKNIYKKYYIYLLAFTVPVFLLVLVYALRGVYPFGSNSVLVLDLNAQYIYYYEAFRDAILNGGSFLYSFSRTLGGEFIGILAYYLASPFSLVLLIFPKEFITEAILCIILLKVGFSSVTFALYLKHSRGAKNLNILMFSIMYALMSFMIVQTMNPMWLDGLVLLPLIFLGVERLINSGKFFLLVISLSLLFVSNYYIGYMTGIFTFVYFFYFLLGKSNISKFKEKIKKTAMFFGSATVSVGLAAWLLIPTYYSLSMGKLEFTSPSFIPIQKVDIFDLLIKLLPVTYDSVNYQGFPFIFSGTIILLLTTYYFINKKINSRDKIAAASFIGIMVACFMVSTLDVVIHGFQFPNWLNFRYSFIFSFFLICIAYDAFVNMQGISKKNIAGVAFALVMLISLIGKFQYEFLVIEKSIWVGILLIVIFSVLLSLMLMGKRKLLINILLIVIISIEMGANAYVIIQGADDEVYYSDRPSYRDYFDRLNPLADYIKRNDDSFYRAETVIRRTVNDPMALGLYGVSHSSSVLNADIITMLHKIGLASQEHWTRYKGSTIMADSLLGIKYIISENEVANQYETIYSQNDLNIYENQFVLPIAFVADKAISTLELDSTDPFINQNALFSSLLGQEYTDYFKLNHIKEIVFENMDAFQQEGYVSYSAINPGLNAHIEYILESAENNEMYMYLYSEYPRKVNIWLNKEYVDTFYEYESHCIMPLKSHPDEETVSLITTPIEGEYFLNNNMFYYLDTPLFEAGIQTLKEKNIEINKISDRHIRIKAQANTGELLFTTIPFEKGWRILINGNSVKPIKVLDSLMAIELEEGVQDIDMKFSPTGLAIGRVISAISLIVLLIYGIVAKKKKSIVEDTIEGENRRI